MAPSYLTPNTLSPWPAAHPFGGYCSLSDLREEGVTVPQASNERLTKLTDEASRTIDAITGWFFEPRSLEITLDGRSTPSLELPVPLIQLHELWIGGAMVPLSSEAFVIEGAPVAPGFNAPRLTLRYGRFPKGRGNITIRGVWGYTEADGTPLGRTPLAIKRACMLLVMRWLYPLADDASLDARQRWRIIEERTRDQSYKLAAVAANQHQHTGDPEIDAILAQYKRPAPLGAV